jgi:uncharacterized membrane protein YphA (DoxX/SURF4 family)
VSTTLGQTTTRPGAGSGEAVELEASRWHDPRFQAFWTMRLGYTVLPLAMGIDKFFNAMVSWPKYLADWISTDVLPGTPQQIMYGVGVVEIVAGILVFLKPRYAAYIVAAWLLGIVINLWSYGEWWDISVRDFGLMLGALALGRLARVYDPPFGRRV